MHLIEARFEPAPEIASHSAISQTRSFSAAMNRFDLNSSDGKPRQRTATTKQTQPTERAGQQDAAFIKPTPVVSSHNDSNEDSFSLFDWLDEQPLIKRLSTWPSPPLFNLISLQSLFTSERLILLTVTCVKILLYPTLYSTDFHVHRNWLAVTNSLPASQWYTDATNEWTLDYPPLFAYAQYAMTFVARWFDPRMLESTSQHYESEMTKLFMRTSVILCDSLLYYALQHWSQTQWSEDEQWSQLTASQQQQQQQSASPRSSQSSAKQQQRLVETQNSAAQRRLVIFALLFAHPALLLLDHMHFQYNGALLALLVLCLSQMRREQYRRAALTFAVLLHAKHIFLYLAPCMGLYLLRVHCFRETIVVVSPKSSNISDSPNKPRIALHSTTRKRLHFMPQRFIALGLIVVAVSIVSFAPFVHQLPAIASRLFPWLRGLSHAYWASNCWSLYNATDLVLTFVCKRMQWLDASKIQPLTGGLVHDIRHTVLPAISSRTTLVLTALSMSPALWRLWRCASYSVFHSCLVYCALCAFMLGWHVHEKALMLALVPCAMCALDSSRQSRLFLLLSTVSTFVLFPLFQDPESHCVKVILLLTYHLAAWIALQACQRQIHDERRIVFTPLLRASELLYAIGLLCVYLLWAHVLPAVLPHFQFLPLLLVSCYCALGCCAAWYISFQLIRQQCQVHHDDDLDLDGQSQQIDSD